MAGILKLVSVSGLDDLHAILVFDNSPLIIPFLLQNTDSALHPLIVTLVQCSMLCFREDK